MDKNTVIGLLLIFGLFMGFSFYQTNKNQKLRKAQEEQLAEQAQQKAEEEKAIIEAVKIKPDVKLNQSIIPSANPI